MWGWAGRCEGLEGVGVSVARTLGRLVMSDSPFYGAFTDPVGPGGKLRHRQGTSMTDVAVDWRLEPSR